MSRRTFVLVAFLASLAGCDQLGIESATATAARLEADGKAVGAACRHGGRAIEDCFTLNKRTDKAAIYAGWREMDDYMRENKIEPVPPTLAAAPPKKAAEGEEATASEDAKSAQADKPADKLAKADARPARGKGDKAAATDADKPAATH